MEHINLDWQKLKSPDLHSWFFFDFIIIFLFSIINFLTLKDIIPTIFILFTFILNVIYILLLILLFYTINLDIKLNIVYFISITLIYISIYLFNLIGDLITLLLLLEFYSVMYYYFFILKSFSKNFNILKYKNLLLLYIWNSFLVTSVYVISCIFLILQYFSLNFIDIIYLYDDNSLNLGLYLFISSFFWKLGLPGYHWLKLEIYVYLSELSIFMYSIFTTLINSLLLLFICINFFSYFIFNLFNIYFIIFIFSILILSNSMKLYNFLYFFAYSSILTLTILIISIFF